MCAACCVMFEVCCLVLVVCCVCMVFVGSWILCAVRRMVCCCVVCCVFVSRLFFVAVWCVLMFVGWRFLFLSAVCCLLSDVCCVVFVVCCLMAVGVGYLLLVA